MKRCSIRTFDPAAARRLALANHMDRFVAGDCAPSCPEGAKMLACTHPAFDGPISLLQDVTKILHGAMLAFLLQSALVFELHNRRRVRSMLVGVDASRRRMIRFAQRFGQEALCCGGVLLCREQEVDRRTI